MNRRLVKVVSLMLVITLLVVSSLVGCGKKEEGTIRMGLLMPLSGTAYAAYKPVEVMYDLLTAYTNNETPIPGVKLELVKYDTKFDPAQSIPGYDWLKDQGAVWIGMTDTTSGETLKSTVDLDKFPIFLGSGTSVVTQNPGYVFCVPPTYYQQVQGFLEWLGDSWPNYPTKPKIGVFGWSITWGNDFGKGAQDYCAAHPDKFDWVGKYLTPYGTNTWFAEVEALKDCDYIICGAFSAGAATFINEFRAKGYKGTFVGNDPWGSFWSVYVASCGKSALDGTLIMSNFGNHLYDHNPVDSLVARILTDYGTADEQQLIIANSWSGVADYVMFYFQVEMLREAVKRVGDPADITGELLYEIATNQTVNIEGYPTLAFSATSRVLIPYTKVYQYSSLGDDWHALRDWVAIPGS